MEAEEEMDFTHIKSRFSQTGKREDGDITSSDIGSTADTTFSGMGTDFRGSVMMKRRTTKDKVKLEDFEIKSQLGRGTFGRVYLAELSTNRQLYAIKAIRKDVLIEYDQIASTLLEKDIMFEADHPFLVGMDYLF